MQEEPKRLSPTNAVLRKLYLKSGNRCAFPNCKNVLMNEEGAFIGQICHIEAVSVEGTRFNPNQTNEDRRSFENLILLCYEHHVQIDDKKRQNEFTVEFLKKIKREHEQKFTDIVEKIRDSIHDHTTSISSKLPLTFRNWYELNNWDLDEESLDATLAELKEFSKILEKLPSETRKLLAIIVERAGDRFHYSSNYDLEDVYLAEITEVCKIDLSVIWKHLLILRKYRFISALSNSYEDFEFEDIEPNLCPHVSMRFSLCTTPGGWHFWSDLKKISKLKAVSIAKILESLDFSVFEV